MAPTRTARQQQDREDDHDVILGGISKDIEYIKRDIGEIKANVQHGYVTKDEFEPIKRIVYGLVGLILVAVVGAIVSLVVRSES